MAHLDVEIFEGNGVDVRTVQRPQRRQVGPEPPAEIDPPQVGVQIE